MEQQKEGKGPEAVPSGYVKDKAGGTASAKKLLRFKLPNKKVGFIIIAALTVLIAASYISYTFYQDAKERATIVHLPTEEAFVADKLSDLTATPPKTSDPADKRAQYYEQLASLYAQQEDYKKAAEALKQRESISERPVGYTHYLYLAEFYDKAGDSKAALAALDQAVAILPEQSDPATEYSKERMVMIIESLRQVYKP